MFQIIWFVLWAVLWAVYFMLDGFVQGSGMLHFALGKTESQKRMLIKSIGPVWNGNEVWLVTAGGATFAAFPGTYASMFSYLYTALLLLLFSLILRGVSVEFRGKEQPAAMKKFWDAGIFLGGLLPALLFGVAFGNIFEGLPIDVNGYQGSFLSLLNPFGLLTGVLFVLLFSVHGALYTVLKNEGELGGRAGELAKKLWPSLLAVAVLFLAAVPFSTRLLDNYLHSPILFMVPAIAVAALLAVRIFLAKQQPGRSFIASCINIVTVVFTGVAGLYPNLIPSRLDPACSLTIFNSSSSPYTLRIMTVVAFVFVPTVIAYKIWVYRVFSGRITEVEVQEEDGNY